LVSETISFILEVYKCLRCEDRRWARKHTFARRSSLSFILEVCVFCDNILGTLEFLVVAAAWNVTKHFFVPVRERWREVSLLRMPFHFSPLHSADGLGGFVGARTRTVHLWDDPGRGQLGVGLVDFRNDEAGLDEIDVSVVVLCGGYLSSEPLLMVCEMHSGALAALT